ncbi:MAG: hypothetical protein OEV47_18880 [Gammaproteobacteria bacterium]|nr:hypothetical protein [Gammaproteobacteria bacterium]
MATTSWYPPMRIDLDAGEGGGVYTTSRDTVVQIFTESGGLLREVPLPGELSAAGLYFIEVISPVERIGRIVIKDPLPGSSLLGGMVSRVVSICD